MFRRFYNELSEWEDSAEARPLLIVGARQVGKTWIIKEFCEKTYKHYMYFNLELREDIASIFEETIEPALIIRRIEQIEGITVREDTALVFDEIQQSERAITSLKYFCEAKENYRIIGAGSLLGVKLERFRGSFPVGKVIIKHLYPMDFEEFLIASGEDKLRDGIREMYESRKPLPTGVHDKALRLYHDYLMLGGMPEIVSGYLEQDKDIMRINRGFYNNLQLAYLADMTKYTISAAEGVKITEVYRSIPKQLARENPKFKYKDVRPYANKRDFISSLDWLVASGLVYRVKCLDSPNMPLKAYEKDTGEKIYLSDVGLLTAYCNMSYNDLLSDSDNIYKGGVVENYVIQEFSARECDLYYYKPSERMEIDLIQIINGELIPIEIKSGRHKRSRSLNNYIKTYNPPYVIRLSELNMGFVNNILSVPLYAAWCICKGVE